MPPCHELSLDQASSSYETRVSGLRRNANQQKQKYYHISEDT
jgi:hypothetical protein